MYITRLQYIYISGQPALYQPAIVIRQNFCQVLMQGCVKNATTYLASCKNAGCTRISSVGTQNLSRDCVRFLHLALAPEEIINKLLLGSGCVHHNLDGHHSLVVLVSGHVHHLHVFILVLAVVHLNVLVHLELDAVHHFGLLGALKEDHVSAVLLGQGMTVQGLLGPGSGNIMAVGEAVRHLTNESAILTGRALAHHLGEAVVAEEVHVDLTGSVQHLHLCEDTAQVGKLGHHALLKLHHVLHKFILVFLCDLK